MTEKPFDLMHSLNCHKRTEDLLRGACRLLILLLVCQITGKFRKHSFWDPYGRVCAATDLDVILIFSDEAGCRGLN